MHNGKLVHRTVSPQQAAVLRLAIINYRKVKKLLRAWEVETERLHVRVALVAILREAAREDGPHVVVAHAEVGKLELDRLPVSGRTVSEATKGTRPVDYALLRIHEATIVDGSLLEPGMELDGPAIIENVDSTTVVNPSDRVSIDEYGNVHISVGQAGGGAG
jgi:N-methylhydantoinase A/oxoprolinase/acetone carboxylase beta subunit